MGSKSGPIKIRQVLKQVDKSNFYIQNLIFIWSKSIKRESNGKVLRQISFQRENKHQSRIQWNFLKLHVVTFEKKKMIMKKDKYNFPKEIPKFKESHGK